MLGTLSLLIALPALADDFKSANGLYDAGKFAEAAAAYEQIEPKTAHVYFNLGNACFRQEKFGPAILNYERARQLAPRDPDVLANLRFARQRAGVEETQRFVQRAVESRTLREWSRYQLAGVWLTVLAVAGAVWWPRWRTGLSVCALAAGLVTTVAAAALLWQWRAPPAAIAVARSEARFAPAPDATVHFELPEGAKVSVRETRGAWSFVERNDGQQGWVRSEAVAAVGTSVAR